MLVVIPIDGGGAIYVDNCWGAELGGGSKTTIQNSTFFGNSVAGTASGSGGGALMSDRPCRAYGFTIKNTTFARNVSSVDGGGLEFTTGSAAVIMLQATIFQNVATGKGGNIVSFSSTNASQVQNTIVAGGSASLGKDVYNGGAITSNGYNLIQFMVAGNTITPAIGDLNGQNPKLSALADNGGKTQTNADSASSPGYNVIPISGGSCNGTGVKTDQRNDKRPGTGHTKCDIGAYEFQN